MIKKKSKKVELQNVKKLTLYLLKNEQQYRLGSGSKQQ